MVQQNAYAPHKMEEQVFKTEQKKQRVMNPEAVKRAEQRKKSALRTKQRKAEAAQAVMLAARAAVAQAQSNVDYCTIRSPLSGIAGFARADVGSYVSAGSEPMVTVSCVHPIRVSLMISELDWKKHGGAGVTPQVPAFGQYGTVVSSAELLGCLLQLICRADGF